MFRDDIEELGEYGFHVFNPRPQTSEEEDGKWASRVISEIESITE